MPVRVLCKVRAVPGLMKLVEKSRKPRACLVCTGLREMEIIDVTTRGVSSTNVLAALHVWAASKRVGWRWGLGAFSYHVSLSESASHCLLFLLCKHQLAVDPLWDDRFIHTRTHTHIHTHTYIYLLIRFIYFLNSWNRIFFPYSYFRFLYLFSWVRLASYFFFFFFLLFFCGFCNNIIL